MSNPIDQLPRGEAARVHQIMSDVLDCLDTIEQSHAGSTVTSTLKSASTALREIAADYDCQAARLIEGIASRIDHYRAELALNNGNLRSALQPLSVTPRR